MIEFFGTIDSALIMHANQVTLGFSLFHLCIGGFSLFV
jgi:hypothetical protein